jgi:hypothetical protein
VSNAIMDAFIAAEVAGLTPVADVPTGLLGYGVDWDCLTDVTEDFAEVDPFSPRAVAQAIGRRWITPRGGLADDADYGCDVRQELNTGVVLPSGLDAIAVRLRNEAKKDDRVDEIAITPTFTLATETLDITAVVRGVNARTGTFTFTFAVTRDGAALLGSVAT